MKTPSLLQFSYPAVSWALCSTLPLCGSSYLCSAVVVVAMVLSFYPSAKEILCGILYILCVVSYTYHWVAGVETHPR